METYYDTSCLIKLYIPEKGSDRVTTHVQQEGKSLFFTPLQETELRNAIALKAFREDITADQVTALFMKLSSDIRRQRLLRVSADWTDAFNRTNELSLTYTIEEGCRTLDILHVALASSFNCQRFISNDERQCSLARRIGMITEW